MESSRRVLVLAAMMGCLLEASFLGASDGKSEGGRPGGLPASAVEPAPVVDKSVVQIAKEVRPSLVKVTQFGREGVVGVGSGFVIGAEGLIATNRHVIGEARRLKVETSDGVEHEVTEVVASDNRLDLAILRVATQGLRPLALGDSEAIRQGEPIVAMGNPAGLTFSVVEGVVSEPQRDIEGLPMIQVAVPIEQGNSGGPLLDRQGRVLGVLTLKSARAENLGFAMPVNALRKLWKSPNPVPMERWLTIGVLNPRFWSPRLGAQWTQRAGVVHAALAGSGFGGRALCLWKTQPEGEVFEATVSVRLQDETGAAGLAFCADAENRHYGFYPTGGRLRLTRFDGPDVFSWKILREVESSAYVSGEWNALRVRVEGGRIRCFVNETEVVDLEDLGLRGGLAGLCKFRAPSASFKDFQIGLNLAPPSPSAESVERVAGSVDLVLGGNLGREEALRELLKDSEAGVRTLESRRRSLEKQAALLKELGADLHQLSVREELVAELSKPEEQADLFRCALLLAKHDNPDLDVRIYERGFSQLTEELRGEPEISAGTVRAVKQINRFLFEESGFHGSRSDYQSRSNSYINEVLDDREGLPITLSVVYLELARRLGVSQVVGIPLPGRFMVGYRGGEEGEYSLVDVFHGGKELTMEEGVDSVTGGGEVSEKAKQPATKREIILRMIRNLMGPMEELRALRSESLPYLEMALALDPQLGRERVCRAVLRQRKGDRAGAVDDLRTLIENFPPEFNELQRRTLEGMLRGLENR
ncbi:MAG: hypothetical protein RLZZ399_1795 [Verrucomicrobiota bacterium]|jgi:S1-C subfamily serine protease/regulator of sirC expression with transglutaminase-like and TPR domain